jgi:hypothetical protein
MHGVKPLHVRKGIMHASKIREPRDTKRCTLVQIGYDFGGKPAPPGLPLALWSKDKASVASSDDMSRSLDHRHKERLYVEKARLWNPADADVELHI